MSNAAIVISVSDYDGELAKLPGCVADSKAIQELIHHSKKYDQVLLINNSEHSSIVKERLAAFISSLQDTDVDELLFYFTGHGLYYEEEFYYALSDYKSSRRNSTALTNTELDTLVRSVNPGIFAKIVDACQSGVSYIKGKEDLEEYIKGQKGGFRKLYFLFSSSTQQSSYQSSQISDFTEALLDAVVSHQGDRIRYPDLMAFVSDKFRSKSKQTPFFVTQADFTEVFCELNDELRLSLRPFVVLPPTHSNNKLLSVASTLVERIKAAANDFGSEEDARTSVQVAFDALKGYTFKPEIADLYQPRFEEDENYPPKGAEIGKWLSEASKSQVIFAKATTKEEEYFAPAGLMFQTKQINALLGIGEPKDEPRMVKRTRQVITGYSNTADLPFQYVSCILDPTVKSIGPEKLYMAFLVSRNKIFLFYRMTSFEYSGWDQTRLKLSTDWQVEDRPLLDKATIQQAVSSIVADFESQLIDRLQADFLPESQVDESDAASPESEETKQLPAPDVGAAE